MLAISRALSRSVRNTFAGGLLGLASAGLAGPAAATQILHPSPTNCTPDDCNAVLFVGTINSVTGSRANPWTVELFAAAEQCIRLTIAAGTPEALEIVAVAPDGKVYRNQDNPPLVKFVMLKGGWNSVSVSQIDGAPIERDFDFSYGLYTNKNNPNCANPTRPK